MFIVKLLIISMLIFIFADVFPQTKKAKVYIYHIITKYCVKNK